MNNFSHALNMIRYSKDPALFLDPMVSVSYVVSELLVKNKVLHLLRIIKNALCGSRQRMVWQAG